MFINLESTERKIFLTLLVFYVCFTFPLRSILFFILHVYALFHWQSILSMFEGIFGPAYDQVNYAKFYKAKR
jgi:hypothetical protein